MSANGDKRERVGETVVETVRTGQDKALVRNRAFLLKSGASGYRYAILTLHINQTLQNKIKHVPN